MLCSAIEFPKTEIEWRHEITFFSSIHFIKHRINVSVVCQIQFTVRRTLAELFITHSMRIQKRILIKIRFYTRNNGQRSVNCKRTKKIEWNETATKWEENKT